MSTEIEATLKERGDRYGKFEDHAKLCQGLKDLMQNFRLPNQGGEVWKTQWEKLAPDQKQALEVIMDKVARILNGDPNYLDNWHDIQGYAKLVEDRLKGEAPSCPDKETQVKCLQRTKLQSPVAGCYCLNCESARQLVLEVRSGPHCTSAETNAANPNIRPDKETPKELLIPSRHCAEIEKFADMMQHVMESAEYDSGSSASDKVDAAFSLHTLMLEAFNSGRWAVLAVQAMHMHNMDAHFLLQKHGAFNKAVFQGRATPLHLKTSALTAHVAGCDCIYCKKATKGTLS